MSISSLSFLAILAPVLVAAYYFPLCKGMWVKNGILLLASLGLYYIGAPSYIGLLVLSILLNYGMVWLEMRSGKHLWGNMAIVLDLLLLLGFKYINQIILCFPESPYAAFRIILPIGISYFTFREISFIVDNRKKSQSKAPNLLEAGLYISNFMTITAGPLGFWEEEASQYQNRRTDSVMFHAGVLRIAGGLVKKVLIADSLGTLVSSCFGQEQVSLLMAWAGAIAYTLQIYFDFSGYSDMAIGFGQLFGFTFPENFSLPYTAKSISQFWKKWHMSLTRWFTRYVYIPLGGSRVSSKGRHIFNLWVVWLCTGIWHGSHLTFILWGMIYFVFQTMEKYTALPQKLQRLHLGQVYTLLIVVINWVIFRAESLGQALRIIGAMFGYRAAFVNPTDIVTIKYYFGTMLAGVLLSSSLVTQMQRYRQESALFRGLYDSVLILLFLASVFIMIGRGYAAPLYAGF